MSEEVLNKIEELLNEYNESIEEAIQLKEGDMQLWELAHIMGLSDLLIEFDYDYDYDENGKIKVIKRVK